jgi:hypothetical protein
MVLIESPHDLGFRFNEEYYLVNFGSVVLEKASKTSRLYPGGFIYEFRCVK